MSPSVMHAGMVAFDTESWPTPKRRRTRVGEGVIDCRAACVTLLASILYMSKCHKGDDVDDDKANAASF